MPELPEVETIKRDLEKHLISRKILGISFCDAPKLLQPSQQAVEEAVKGQIIEKFSRIAKLLFIHLSNKKVLAVHLKLSGRLLLRNQKDKPDVFTHVIIELNNGQELRFSEMRKFGYIKLIDGEEKHHSLLAEFGPEPMTAEFTPEVLSDKLKKTSRPVKVLIMDQSQVAGVGNIYADEALWCAKIHPSKKANELNPEEIKKLHECLEKALEEGIKDRGTSLDMYLDAWGNKGDHALNLKVFRQDGKPCPRDGTIVKKIRVGGRGTHFCPTCQKL